MDKALQHSLALLAISSFQDLGGDPPADLDRKKEIRKPEESGGKRIIPSGALEGMRWTYKVKSIATSEEIGCQFLLVFLCPRHLEEFYRFDEGELLRINEGQLFCEG